VKYPKLPFHLDRRKKLTLTQIKKIFLLHQEGCSYRAIGRLFRVSKNTIHYHCDIHYKKKVNKQRSILLKKQGIENPDWLKQRRRRNNAIFRENTKRFEPQRKYKIQATVKWRKKRYHNDEEFREKIKQWSKKAYQREQKKRF